MNILIIFIILLFAIIIVSRIRKGGKKLTERCNSDSDCSTGFSCLVDPEESNIKKCFPSNKIFCPITPNTYLIPCDLGKTGKESDCDKCLNNPKYSCIAVSHEKPYTYIKDGNIVNIPNSREGKGWCLPDIENKNIVCNEFTSDYVLTEIEPGSGKFTWSCLCKYPNLFDHSSGSGSDCNLVRACGEEVPGEPLGVLYVPTENKCKKDLDCKDGEKCLSELSPYPCGISGGGIIQNTECTGDNCVCHSKWEGEVVNTINPLSGRCVCNPELDFQCLDITSGDYQFNCVKGYCRNPEGATEDTVNCNPEKCKKIDGNCFCCDCPSGWIRCPDDISSNNQTLIEFCRENGPLCIKDPCSTKEIPNGRYDSKSGVCICGDSPSAVSYNDPNSPVGVICKDLCNSSNNPCGNRGTCYVPQESQTALCCDCIGNWTNTGDNNCTCSQSLGLQENGSPCCQNTDCASGNCQGADCSTTDCSGGPHPSCFTNPSTDWRTADNTGTCTGTLPINSSCGTPCIPQGEPVVCADNTSTCPYNSTCCKEKDGSYSCCPEPNGVCCGEGKCCTSDYPVCKLSENKCYSKDGKKSIQIKS